LFVSHIVTLEGSHTVIIIPMKSVTLCGYT